jgi:uncharacterized protein YwqG
VKLPPIPKSLERVSGLLENYSADCIAFSLEPIEKPEVGRSRIGGCPDLPEHFAWPSHADRPLDYLLQLNLSELSRFEAASILPQSGLLTFFYDLKNMPWGYDPRDLGGFRVTYSPQTDQLRSHDIPDAACAIRQCQFRSRAGISLPAWGSSAFEELRKQANLNEAELDYYCEFASALCEIGAPPKLSGNHRILGHSANIQGDMQLEAQLVTNGLYCGNATGYDDPRAAALCPGARDWVLLLQLDSDDTGEFMWGDTGMLYYWIRLKDLAEMKFDRVWMTLQCG